MNPHDGIHGTDGVRMSPSDFTAAIEQACSHRDVKSVRKAGNDALFQGYDLDQTVIDRGVKKLVGRLKRLIRRRHLRVVG